MRVGEFWIQIEHAEMGKGIDGLRALFIQRRLIWPLPDRHSTAFYEHFPLRSVKIGMLEVLTASVFALIGFLYITAVIVNLLKRHHPHGRHHV